MIYALLAATLFAFVDIAWRRILPGVSIWRALFWRSLASSFLLLAAALLWEDLSGLTAWSIQDAVHHLGWPVVTGVLGLVFFSLALQVAAAQLVVPIINLTGLFVWLWEWGWFGRVEQAGLLSSLAVLLAAHGLAWWVVPAWRGPSTSKSDALGAGLSLLAVLTWSRGYVAYPAALEQIPPFALAGSVELAMLISGAVALLWVGRTMGPGQRRGALGVGVVVAVAVACVTLAYARIPASEVGLFSMLTPVLVVAMDRLWLRTPLRRQDVVAIVSLLTANGLYLLAAMAAP